MTSAAGSRLRDRSRSSVPPGDLHVFGIRHHGPGSARSLLAALEALGPDILLIEGPPDANGLIEWAARPELEPPVALLVYNPENLRQASYYPFAVFSPEWQALQYGLRAAIPVRWIDLPLRNQFPIIEQIQSQASALPPAKDASPEGMGAAALPEIVRQPAGPETVALPDEPPDPPSLPADPLAWIARSAGYSDGELWWEHQVEQRRDSRDLFAAILELMTALRLEVEQPAADRPLSAGQTAGSGLARPAATPFEAEREAWMRRAVRQARKDGFRRIAVVCGAWHSPALAAVDEFNARQDERLIKALPAVKTAAAWTPWTYGQLTLRSGYGAGVTSPGWYHHLWEMGADCTPEGVVTHWIAQVARLLRGEDLDAAPAQIIETVRLAEALAALRGRPLPGLPELTEAVQTVLCMGEALPLKLIEKKLIVSERMGTVPEGAPAMPLQVDLRSLQKRLRLPPNPEPRDLDLDLRKLTDLERSRMLHRLLLLKIPWGVEKEARGRLGTFHELWQIQWQPELALAVIDAGLWGNTVAEAAAGRAIWLGEGVESLAELTALLQRTLLAELPEAATALMERLENAAALSSDVGGIMDALPPLAEVSRYGDVRSADRLLVSRVAGGLLQRICIGLPPACASLDDEAAIEMYDRLVRVHAAVGMLPAGETALEWRATLVRLSNQTDLHGIVAGRAVRLLLDGKLIDPAEAGRRMGLALSPANPPNASAAWLDGFLRGSGLLLLHDVALWQVLDEWMSRLSLPVFTQVLPILRRTFATFARPERRQIGERVQYGANPHHTTAPAAFDFERADAVLPQLSELLGFGHTRDA